MDPLHRSDKVGVVVQTDPPVTSLCVPGNSVSGDQDDDLCGLRGDLDTTEGFGSRVWTFRSPEVGVTTPRPLPETRPDRFKFRGPEGKW